MRKGFAVIILLSVLSLVLVTGCNNGNGKVMLNQTIDKVKSSKSLKFDGVSNMKVNGQPSDVMKFEGSFRAPNENYVVYDRTYMGEKVHFEYYQKGDIIFKKLTDKWEKADASEVESAKQDLAGGSPIAFLTDIRDNAAKITYNGVKTLEGKKYTEIKAVAKEDKLVGKIKDAVQNNYKELVSHARPEDKDAVAAQKQQMDEFLKTLKVKMSYTIYIDKTTKALWRIDMNQTTESVIEKQKLLNEQQLTLYYKDYNKPVQIPDVTK